MYKIPLADLKDKLIKSGKISAGELELRMKAKINELSGLISEEGAAHIIANELGVEVMNSSSTKLKVKELYAGMRGVGTVGKVVRKFEVREFAKNDRTGKVASVILGDDTGTIRVVFWNDQVDVFSKVQEDDVLLIKDAYVRENNGGKELHLGTNGDVTINPEGETIHIVRRSASFERKQITELRSGEESVEIMGTVIQVFDPRFFTVCGQCNRKVVESGGIVTCSEHGTVSPTHSYVLNAVLDDGTGTIRAVFWRNQTVHFLGKQEEEILSYKENPSLFEDVKTDLLGEQFKVMGRVKRNDMFDRLELNAQLVEKANPQEEIVRLEKAR